MEDCTCSSIAIAKGEVGVQQADKAREGKEQRAEEVIQTRPLLNAVVPIGVAMVVVFLAISGPLLSPVSDV